MNQLKAIIFDVDGTLAETERDGHRVAFNRAFDAAGINWHWDVELYGKLLAVTGGKERIRYFIESVLNQTVDEHTEALIATLHQHKTAFYKDIINSGQIHLREGVERLINEARAHNIILAIATTTTPQNVDALIENTLGQKALSWFQTIAAGDVVEHKKPAPDIYEYCLSQLGLSPTSCLAIEDSENGLKAALNANIATLITTNSYTRDEHFSGAMVVVDGLGEPDSACHSIKGDILNDTYISIDVLRSLHSNAIH